MDVTDHGIGLSDGEYSGSGQYPESPFHYYENEDGKSTSTLSSPKHTKLSDGARPDRARPGRRSHHEPKKSHKSTKRKKKHRRRDRSRSSSSRSASPRSRSRSRERSHRHREHSPHRRSRRHSSDRRSGYSENDRYRERSRGRDRSSNQTPTNTIMIRGLPLNLTEKEIANDLVDYGISPKDVRLIRHRDTGLSRGFCFIEFNEVTEAEKYMHLKKGIIVFQDQYEATMIYSVGRESNAGDRNCNGVGDWFCFKCASHNFKRRDICFRCQSSKYEDGAEELREELSKSATTTLLLQDLDMLSTEDSVQQALGFRSDLRSILAKCIKIPREAITNLSRGVCFLETNTVSDAVRFHDALVQCPLVVDERTLRVAYCKPPVQAVSLNSAAAAALAAAQWSTTGPMSDSTSVELRIQQLAEYSASLYAKTPEEKAKYLTYYVGYYREQHSKGERLIGDGDWNESNLTTVNSGESEASLPATARNENQATAISIAPDVTRLQYDTSTGYYYDPVTLLYYDTTSERYYDSLRQEFLTWDASKCGYVPAPDSTELNATQPVEPLPCEDKDYEAKNSRIKVHKGVLKDILKQAVNFNAKKDVTRVSLLMEESNGGVAPSKKSSDARTTLIEASRIAAVGGIAHAITILAEPVEKDTISDEDETRRSITPPSISDSFLDVDKLACTLCKRQFGSLDILTKHTKLSELHKTNLANLRQGSVEPIGSAALIQKSYRDRAKERRNFFGPEDMEPKNAFKQKYMEAVTAINEASTPEPPSTGITEDNIGSRLLRKMGWKTGKGLGKNETGRTDIITAELRPANAGLGHPVIGSQSVSTDKDRYSRARDLTLARYKELDGKF